MQTTQCWNDYKGNTIRLRWSIRNGDRIDKYLLSLGVKRGQVGLAYARTVSAWIESDVLQGKFDTTLEKYHNPKGTKTKMDRSVELPPTGQAMLKSRFIAASPKPDDLVFPSPKRRKNTTTL
jgi:hypothetical protein